MKKLQTMVVISFLIIITIPTLSESNKKIILSGCDDFYVNLMNIPIKKEMITKSNLPQFKQTSQLPNTLSWKEYQGKDWTTPAKHQGECGSCWDFAAIGALESVIKIRENRPDINLDLSEQYVLSCLPAAANNYGRGCLGGTPYNALFYMMDNGSEGNYKNGALPESCMPYGADHEISCELKCEDWLDKLVPISECGESWLGFDSEQNREIVKQIIFDYGPIASGINVSNEFIQWGNRHHRENEYFADPKMPWGNRLNHIIVIVGWHNDESIENGGYWICKNSWGQDWGYDGFFNIEYGGLFTASYISWVDYEINNLRPDKPDKPLGNPQLKINEEGNFTFLSNDPEGEDIFYLIDWGNKDYSDWIGPLSSGTPLTISHIWDKKGSFDIKVKAKDIHEYESEWSDPLQITLQKYKTYNLFFNWIFNKIESLITNFDNHQIYNYK